MENNWPYRTIEDIAEKVGMGPFGSSIKVSTFVPDGIPVISGQHLHGTKLQDKDNNFITLEHAEQLKSANVYHGDVIFTHAGSIGQAAYIPDDSKYDRYVISQRQFYMRCNTKKVLPEFVAYYFKSKEGQHKLLANRSSTGVPSIARPVTYLRSIEIPVPSIRTQEAILSHLLSLEDKIELNRRMNETLEAMARAIFKSWFVDFDPVRAKSEGRDTGLPSDIAALFPDSFVDSELGKIPKGWKDGKVEDVGQVICGKTPSTKVREYYGNDIPFITIPDMHGKIFTVKTQKNLSYAGANSQKNKTLPTGSICVSCIATTGLVVVTARESQTNQQINSVVPNYKEQTSFWYGTFRNLGDEIKAAGSGGSVLTNLNTSRFSNLKILIPPDSIRNLYHAYISSFFDLILSNDYNTSNLSKIRDSLLPKLMSGEIFPR
jgi:type I restriction enzyme S subunit